MPLRRYVGRTEPVADMKSYLTRIDEWLRTRLRTYIWKSWKTIGNKYRNLRKLGTSHANAMRMANTRKGYRRSADSPIVKLAISKELFLKRPLRKFCVSVFRQNQEYHIMHVHDWGLFPLGTAFPGGWDGMRAGRRECRPSLLGILMQGDQPTFRSANMISN